MKFPPCQIEAWTLLQLFNLFKAAELHHENDKEDICEKITVLGRVMRIKWEMKPNYEGCGEASAI